MEITEAPLPEEGRRPSLVMLPYMEGVSEDIRWVCRKFGLKVVFRSGLSLRSMLTRVKDTLVMEKSKGQPEGHPTSRQVQPAIPVEMGVLQPDVYCLLQQQLLVGPGLVNHRGLLPLDWMVVLPCMLCKGRLLQCPLLACILLLLHPRLEHPHCLSNVLLATATLSSGELVLGYSYLQM